MVECLAYLAPTQFYIYPPEWKIMNVHLTQGKQLNANQTYWLVGNETNLHNGKTQLEGRSTSASEQRCQDRVIVTKRSRLFWMTACVKNLALQTYLYLGRLRDAIMMVVSVLLSWP